jgi:hypothetical protein
MVPNPWFGALEEPETPGFSGEKIVQRLGVLAGAIIPDPRLSTPCFDTGNHRPILLCTMRY